MKSANKRNPSASCEPYLHQMYNIRNFDQCGKFRSENAMTHILNSLIEGLNEHQHIPRMVVIILDHEFLSMLHHTEFGISLMIGKCLHWLMSQVESVIEQKKCLLKHFKPGAISPLEPKLIWLKMMEKLNPSREMSMMKTKFNIILEQVLRQTGSGFIMDPHPHGAFPRNWFDSNGNMIHEGHVEFWRHIDNSVRRFNINKVGLDPTASSHQGKPTARRNEIPQASIWPPHRHAGDG